ncbi:MAG: acetate--CoA ligase family protein [Chloroflexota bacterium]
MAFEKRPFLTPLLNPKSVAVVGATERVGASSGFVMQNLLRHGYAGRIYPVHPRAKKVFGLTAVSTITALETPPDVAVICIAAQHVAAALAEAGQAGTKAAVVLSSGFAEQDEDGKQRQEELRQIAATYGMVVCGPNCLGLIGLHTNTTLYSSRFPHGVPKGTFALISQSGASAIALSSTGRLGFSYLISAGNGAVTTTADYLHFLAIDPTTQVIGLVLETIVEPAAFAAAMTAVLATNKRVIALYVGRSQVGAATTAAHTGALTSSFQAAVTFLRRQGVIVVESMAELLETAVLATNLRQSPRGQGVALIGVSGGGLAHAADFAADANVELPPLADKTVAKLRRLLPPYVTPKNPLDTTGLPFADGRVYQQALDCLADDPAIGLIAAVQDAPVGLDDDGAREYLPIAQGIVDYDEAADVPIAVLSNLAGNYHPIFRQPLAVANIPLLNGAELALKAIKHLLQPPVQKAIASRSFVYSLMVGKWTDQLKEKAAFTERETKLLLNDFGIRTTAEGLATTVAEAVALAEQIGFPVAMKIESPDILHKTEAGGVVLGVEEAMAVSQIFNQLMQNGAAYAPNAELHGVVVQEMVAASVEVFVGISRHDPFGFGITVGVGGKLVELQSETAFELLPLDKAGVEALLAGGTLAKLLAGYRGAAPADRAALVEAILKLAEIVAQLGDYLDTIELNPIAVLPQGEGICVLDGLILVKG